MPRTYDMSKRRAAVEETKRRIVQATMELHNEQGVLATSWEQIAERAGVAPATVYRHFPTLDELLPACGALSFEKLALPASEEFAAELDDLEGTARLEKLVAETFSLYERGGDTIWAVRRDRATLEPMEAAHREIEERLDAMTALALEPLGIEPDRARVVRALIDYDVWSALRARGVEGDEAVREASALIRFAAGV